MSLLIRTSSIRIDTIKFWVGEKRKFLHKSNVLHNFFFKKILRFTNIFKTSNYDGEYNYKNIYVFQYVLSSLFFYKIFFSAKSRKNTSLKEMILLTRFFVFIAIFVQLINRPNLLLLLLLIFLFLFI